MSDWLKELYTPDLQELLDARRTVIAEAEEQAERVPFPNRMAEALHPAVQHLRVDRITPRGSCLSYTLVPDPSRGTKSCAMLSAGQYLSILLNIEGRCLTRPYSICSTPAEAEQGRYEITVERVEGGLASRWIHEHWRVGTPVDTSAPEGQFCYEPLRDAPHIVALAGGSGVTPFVSLAGAIADGDEDCDLTLLYGTGTREDAIYREELARLAASCSRIRVVHVLEKERLPGCEGGYITAEMIRRHAPAGEYTVMLCGPRAMYNAMDRELPKLELAGKRIRRELFGETIDPRTLADCPAVFPEQVTITLRSRGTEQAFSADPTVSLLRTLEERGITVPSRCRSGVCGYCRGRISAGQVYIPAAREHRRMADAPYGWVHLCSAWPLTDVTVEV